MANLTNKQSAFINEYLIDLNATQAAIRAGYSAKTAKDIACENLAKPYIQEAIQKAMEERSKRTEITQDMVINELAKIAFLDIRDVFDEDGKLIPIHDLPDNVAHSIGGIDHITIGNDEDQIGITSKIKLIDKKGSLELLGRHLKMFNDKLDITSNGESITFNSNFGNGD